MANEVSITVTKAEREQARLRSEEKYILDTQSKMAYAREEGMQLGMQLGMQQGMQLGRQLGVQLGRQKIIDLLRSGKSPDEIIRDFTT